MVNASTTASSMVSTRPTAFALAASSVASKPHAGSNQRFHPISSTGHRSVPKARVHRFRHAGRAQGTLRLIACSREAGKRIEAFGKIPLAMPLQRGVQTLSQEYTRRAQVPVVWYQASKRNAQAEGLRLQRVADEQPRRLMIALTVAHAGEDSEGRGNTAGVPGVLGPCVGQLGDTGARLHSRTRTATPGLATGG